MIRIEKDKILYTDPSDEQHEIYPADLPAHLGDIVELGEFVTFARIFDLLLDHTALFNTIFAGDLGGLMIEQFLEEYHKPVSYTNDSYDLEVHIVCQAHHYTDYRDFEYYVAFHGVGILEGDTEALEPYPISLSFTSLNELKNKYIRINNTVEIFSYSEEGNIRRSEAYEGDIKLFDFFAAILNEISFFGDPDSRDEVSQEMIESAEALDGVEEDLMSLEEVRERSDKMLKEAEEEAVRVRMQKLRDQLASGYITDFIESTFRETIEKLELLENDLVSLERYEDAKLVRARIEQLNSAN